MRLHTVGVLLLLLAAAAAVAADPSMYCQHWECGDTECCQGGWCVDGKCVCAEGFTNSSAGCNALSCPYGARMRLHHGNQAQPSPLPDWQKWRVCDCANDFTGMTCSVPTTNASCRAAAAYRPDLYSGKTIISRSGVIVNDIAFACNVTGSWNSKLGGQGSGYVRCVGDYGAPSQSHNATSANKCFVTINMQACSPTECDHFADIEMKMEDCTFAVQSDGKMHYSCASTTGGCSSKAWGYFCSPFTAIIVSQISGPSSFVCDLDGSSCVFSQSEAGFVIPVLCSPGECLAHPVPLPPIPPALGDGTVLALVGGSIAAFVGAVGLCAVAVCAMRAWMERERRALSGPLTPADVPDLEAALRLFREDDPVSLSSEARFEWYGVTLTLDPAADVGYILYDVSGAAEVGTLSAILGESGSGKTSLLHLLHGVGASGLGRGDLLTGSFRGPRGARSALVTQFPALLPHFTVRESLTFAVDSVAPYALTRALRAHVVDLLIAAMELDEVADSPVGDPYAIRGRGLSSGERKRVSLALGLVHVPHLLLADEVTSGLDGPAALRLMRLLQGLADGLGMAVVLTLHAPSRAVLDTVSSVTVIHRGYVVHRSHPSQVVDLEGMLVELGTQDEAEYSQLAEALAWDAPPTPHTHGMVRLAMVDRPAPDVGFLRPRPGQRALGWMDDTVRVWTRMAVAGWRDPLLLRAQYAVTLVSAVVLGGVFYKLPLDLLGTWDRIGLLFMIPSLFAGLATNILHSMAEWVPSARREVGAQVYSGASFVVAFAAWDLVPFRLAPALVFGCIVYWMAGLQAQVSHFIVFEGYVMLVSAASGAVFLVLGAVLHARPLLHAFAASLVHLAFMLFGGFLLNASRVPAGTAWLLQISPVYHAFSGLVDNELRGLVFDFDPRGPEASSSVTLDASVVLRQLGTGDSGAVDSDTALGLMWGVAWAVGALIMWGAALRGWAMFAGHCSQYT